MIIFSWWPRRLSYYLACSCFPFVPHVLRLCTSIPTLPCLCLYLLESKDFRLCV
ncbi:hypothetical protein C8Q78DRAFT_1036782 [Trametes maxima]|nr:hypothetical protein C8Q78DRAFT_1036782 [Trametes maxima]